MVITEGRFDADSLFLLLVLLLAGCVYVLFFKKNRKILGLLFLLAFFLRLFYLIAVLAFNDFNWSKTFCSIDDAVYHDSAVQIWANWNEGNFSLYSSKYYYNAGYVTINAVVYYLLGPNTFNMRLINIFVLSLSIVNMAVFAGKTFAPRIGRRAGFLYVVLPSLIAISVFQFKDVFIVFFFSLFLLSLAKHSESDRKIRYFFFAFLQVGFVYFFRQVYSLFFLFIFAVYFILDQKRKTTLLKKAVLLAVILLFAVYLYLNIQGYSLSIFSDYSNSTIDRMDTDSFLLKLVTKNKLLGYLGSLYLTLFRKTNIGGAMALTLPLYAEYLLNTLFFVPLLIVGLIAANKKNMWTKLMLMIIGVLFITNMIALQGGNFRYGVPGSIVAMIFVSLGIESLKDQKKRQWYFALVFITVSIFAANLIISA